MVFNRKFYGGLLILLMVSLNACGEDNTPVPTATAVSNKAPATATVALPAPTVVPLTTPATGGVSPAISAIAPTINQAQSDNITRVPVLPPTVAADPNVSRAVLASLPTIKGTTAINANLDAVNEQVQKLGLTGAVTRLYVSDEQPASVVNNTEAAILAAGYRVNNPPQQGKTGIYGVYSKVGSPDIAVNARLIDSSQLNNSLVPGLSPAESQKVATQIKGHKTLLLLIVAPNQKF